MGSTKSLLKATSTPPCESILSFLTTEYLLGKNSSFLIEGFNRVSDPNTISELLNSRQAARSATLFLILPKLITSTFKGLLNLGLVGFLPLFEVFLVLEHFFDLPVAA